MRLQPEQYMNFMIPIFERTLWMDKAYLHNLFYTLITDDVLTSSGKQISMLIYPRKLKNSSKWK